MIKKIVKILFIGFMLFSSLSFAEDSAGYQTYTYNDTVSALGDNDTKLTAPIEDIFATHELDLFFKEFYMKLKFALCCDSGEKSIAEAVASMDLSCRPGFQAHMIEPLGYIEAAPKPLYFPFAKLDLGGNVLKGSSTFNSHIDDQSVRGEIYNSHFIFFPLYGIIFGKKMKFVCFHGGDLEFPYLSEFDPTWSKDVYYMKLVPHEIMFFTPSGLVSTIFDCAATSIVNFLNGYNSFEGNSTEAMNTLSEDSSISSFESKEDKIVSASNALNSLRDTVYFVSGCQGFSPIGGYVNGDDPIGDLTLIFHGIAGMLHGASALSPKPFLQKQVNALFNTSSIPNSAPSGAAKALNTMCMPKDYPLPIASQYVLQLAYPTVGTAKELGVSGAETSTLKNVPGANGAVYVVWERRDYYAFAYICPNNDSDEENNDDSDDE